ncbi:MAG: aminotransferase class I/II-fold pyridoxal phosphate-dependent enzyme [Bacteroidales bacterium]|nr:aminotransferase class I/II-fold pyridoxal phosphate-dependent enzyme [Bacteroidales bacterium]
MQAIILAAGMGKRLGELTKNNTKCMVEVNGVKLIDRVLTYLSHLDLKRIVIVVGYQAENLVNYVENQYGSLNIEFVENPIYDKTNNIYSLALAKDKFKEDDTLLLESDLIYEESMLHLLVDNQQPDLALVAKYEKWMDGTMVTIDDDCNILNFISKKEFKQSEVDKYYKTVNIYKFSKSYINNQYLPLLEAYCQMKGNNEYYEEVLRVLTMIDKSSLKALPIGDEKWYEIDDIQDLDIAETIFAEGDLKLKKYMKRYGGYWRFPKLLDFCYLVNPYFPTPKMKDELRANFDVLLQEYPSGMFVNSLLAGKYFNIRQEYVCVGNGAAELIKSAMENFADKKIGVVYPTFEEYPNRMLAENIVKYIPENPDFAYTADDLKAFFGDKGIKLLLLVNPDNPSGNYIKKNDVLQLVKWAAERKINIIVDESFVDFTDNHKDNSLLHNDILESNPNLMVMKSISKSYGVPGLRLGVFATSDKEIIAKMKKDVAIWNINSFAEYYMQIFAKYEKDYQEACDKFIEERQLFINELRQIPFLRVVDSQANYFLCEVKNKYTSTELTRNLLEKADILIKDCSTKSAFGGKNYIRIAIRDRKDNSKLVETLKKL